MSDLLAPQMPSPSLRLCSTIDAAEINRLAADLEPVLYEHLLTYRNRNRKFIIPPRKSVAVMRWCSLVGLVATAGIWALGGLPLGVYQLEHLFLLIFTITLILSFFALPFMQWLYRPWHGYWRYMAKMHTDGLLKQARACVPFDAQYDFDGSSVSYVRIKSGQAQVVWVREFTGLSLAGRGYTLLFKRRSSISPYAIFLHAPSAEFQAWLTQQGISDFPTS